MSEMQTAAISKNDPATDLVANGAELATGQQGAGAMLKQAREARGLHIAALAVLLKVPVKKLEALESDRLDLLPDAVFVRALASSVCRTLKIDSAVILAQLPKTAALKLPYQSTGINEPFRSPGDGPGPSLWAQVSRPAVLAGMLLLLGALVLIFLPAIKTGISEIRLEASRFKTKSIETEIPLSVVTMADLPNAAVSTDVVVFTAKTESWVEATDATGQVVLRRTLAAGEVVGASGALPLRVIVGRADAIQVLISGKVFDVNAVAKDNVARFEVK